MNRQILIILIAVAIIIIAGVIYNSGVMDEEAAAPMTPATTSPTTN